MVSRAYVSAPPPAPHHMASKWFMGEAVSTQSFCLLLVSPHAGICSYRSYILQEGHPGLRRKMASLANFNFYTHLPKILS